MKSVNGFYSFYGSIKTLVMCVCICESGCLKTWYLSPSPSKSVHVCLCILVLHIKLKIQNVIGLGQRSFWGHQRSDCKNLVNMISQKWKLWWISYLILESPVWSSRTLMFWVRSKSGMWSDVVNTLFKKGNFDEYYTKQDGDPYMCEVRVSHSFWWRLKVIWSP